MPNICSTELIIYTPSKEILESLRSKIDDFVHTPACEATSHNTDWLGNLLIHVGFSYTDVFNEVYGCPRGWVAYIGEIEEHVTDGVYFICVDIEDAWGPHIEVWRHFIDKLHPNAGIKIAWMAVECGCDLYQVYDPDNLFYDDCDYIVSSYVPDYEAYEKYPELIDDNRPISAAELKEIFNTDDISEALATADSITERLQEEYGDGYYSIHAFQVMDSEY